MSQLSEALRKYYSRKKGKIFFLENISLNKLSLMIWEDLGFTNMDPSTLSRVISGIRLFTPAQLKSFCKILCINSIEQEFLFYTLTQDYIEKQDVHVNSLFLSTDDMLNLVEEHIKEAWGMVSS